jgi:hypothetical protein
MRLTFVAITLFLSFCTGLAIGLGEPPDKPQLKELVLQYQTIQGRWCKKGETPKKDGCVDGSGSGG